MDSKKDFTNVKILISYSEFERLKKIEQEFLQQQAKPQNTTSTGILHVNRFLGQRISYAVKKLRI